MGYVSDNLETDIYDLKTELSDLGSKISDISSVVGPYNGGFFSARNIYDIAESLESSVENVENSISDFRAEIESSISDFRTEIDALKSSLQKIENFIDVFEQREAEARFDKFWDRHREYRLELQNKIVLSNTEISKIEVLIRANPLNQQIADLKSRLESKRSEKDTLGFFDHKGKKDMKNEIAQLDHSLAQADKQLSKEIAPLIRQIDIFQQNIAKIHDELTKPR